MEIRLQLILIACIVNFGSTMVPLDDEKLALLFETVPKKDLEKIKALYYQSIGGQAPEKNAMEQDPEVNAIYTPIIPDIGNEKAMKKLKKLWIKQSDYLKSAKLAAENIEHKSGHELKGFGRIYNDTEELINGQIKVLSNEPWKNDDEMKIALDSQTIIEQNANWNTMDRCLDDHYKSQEKDDEEKYFRELLDAARSDLQHREEAIKSIVNPNETST